MTDWAVELCGMDSECDDSDLVGNTYDVGWAMFHMLGTFLTQPSTNPIQPRCWTKESCNDLPPTPEERAPADLP
jgi:hypothetical protein